MAALKNEIKAFIVQRLAQFDTPTEIVDAVNNEFGVQITRQAVHRYDPTKAAGANLAKKWVQLFQEFRDRFIEDTSDIATSHKSVRIARLERMAVKAETMRNYALAASLLEQIAKEMGGQFTNLRLVAPTNPKGDEPWQPARNLTEAELDARIAELNEKLGQ